MGTSKSRSARTELPFDLSGYDQIRPQCVPRQFRHRKTAHWYAVILEKQREFLVGLYDYECTNRVNVVLSEDYALAEGMGTRR